MPNEAYATVTKASVAAAKAARDQERLECEELTGVRINDQGEIKRLAGWISIFRGKEANTRIQGIMTPEGRRLFEAARKQLRALYVEVTGVRPSGVSDGDTVEALARGWEQTRTYLEDICKKT